jgi:hypothetical protein
MTREEIIKEIEMLEIIIKFHTESGIIKSGTEREVHINDILDRLSELYEQKRKIKE